jgi:hypothetical protein
MSDHAKGSTNFNPVRSINEWIKICEKLLHYHQEGHVTIHTEFLHDLIHDMKVHETLILGHHWKGMLDAAQEELRRCKENTMSLEEK